MIFHRKLCNLQNICIKYNLLKENSKKYINFYFKIKIELYQYNYNVKAK